jgi:hypothetical protein
MLARCPSCRETFSTDRTGQQICPACKKPLFVPDVAQAIPSPGASNDPGAPHFQAPGPERSVEPEGTPWERRPELSLLAAWKETVTLALFEPNKLFASARLDMRAKQASFAVLTFSVFSIIGNLLDQLLVGPQQEQLVAQLRENLGSRIPPALMKLLDSNTHQSLGIKLLSLLFAPLFGLVFVYLNAAVTHLFAVLLSQNKKGFDATFAACAYAMAPAVLYAIPACGSIVALIWIIVLTGVGLKATHGMTPSGATAATLAPYVVICCAICGLLLTLGSTGMSAITGGGN